MRAFLTALFLAFAIALQPIGSAAAPRHAPADSQSNQGVDLDGPYDGYWWTLDPWVWVPGYISLETWYTPAPRHLVGGAVFYAAGVMRATANQRGMPLEGFLDGVSLMSPADIGRTVWLRRPGLAWEGPFLVVDCARRSDMWPIITTRKEVVEVGWDTAVRWGMGYGHGKPWRLDDVEVWVGDKEPTERQLLRDYPVQDYASWFVDRTRFSTLAEDRTKGHIWTVKDKPGCWLWWDNEVYCDLDFYDAPWVVEADYQPAWLSARSVRWEEWR